MELILFVGAAAVVGLAALALYRRWTFCRAVDKIPGPLAFPLIGTTYIAFLVERQDRLRVFDKVTKQYWPIFRGWMGPSASINVSKPEHIEKILASSELISKAANYRFLFPWLGEGLLTSAGQKWFSHRKMITPAFHFKILDNFVDIFGENSQILVEKLKSKSDGHAFDIYPYITRCALDIICETAMGTSVNAQNETGSEYVSAVYNISALTIKRIVRPWIHSDFIFRRTSTGREYYKHLDVIHSFTKKVIKQRQLSRKLKEGVTKDALVDDIGRKRRLAFLDLLLDASENGQKLSDQEIQEEVDTFMFEGHDTTSVAMCWALLLLGHHQNVQDKLYSELHDIFGHDKDRLPTLQDLNSMKYLEMVIKETLRLYPSVPFIGRKVTKDIEIGGYAVPEGAMLNLHIYHAHRDPDHWPDPDSFNPDNFLPERVQGRHPYAYVPFSAGPRNCIGQRFAILEEKTVLSQILRNYHVQTLDTPEDTKVAIELILKPVEGIMVRLTPR
ncbi:cytochrome P450 4C1-like [Schistocerca nitens]|uniref:cytochrome P450 4C1-like n=1 Tax=Schistocerca nitens TaxID=7011 RepID=UPI00211753D2|nr:cytochrome P450 4C1-like [Schistocerca nitens]